MLNGISKLLDGNLLKVLCDMGHGDEIAIVDATNVTNENTATTLFSLHPVNSK